MKIVNKIFIPYEYAHDGSLPVGVTKRRVFENDIEYIAALTWQDIDRIIRIHEQVMAEAGGTIKDFAEETLLRFNEQRKK